MADSAPLLEVEGLETCYGLSQVLFGLSLSVRSGEMVALMGRNGMGKTTTVRSIMGMTPPRAGAVRFGGRFELDKVAIEVGERVLFDLGCEFPKLLPLRYGVARVVTVLANLPDMRVVHLEMLGRCDEPFRGLLLVDTTSRPGDRTPGLRLAWQWRCGSGIHHASAPLRMRAMWMNFSGMPIRSAHPFW